MTRSRTAAVRAEADRERKSSETTPRIFHCLMDKITLRELSSAARMGGPPPSPPLRVIRFLQQHWVTTHRLISSRQLSVRIDSRSRGADVDRLGPAASRVRSHTTAFAVGRLTDRNLAPERLNDTRIAPPFEPAVLWSHSFIQK